MAEVDSPRNVVIFGQTGAGKSSIINLLEGGREVAAVSGGAGGCTSSNQPHRITSPRDNKIYTFWDTAGLNESDDGSVSSQGAIQNLLNLVKDDGVNLLVYCIRGRLVDITRVNYDLIWRIVCKKDVPILLIVTGLEGEDDMEGWWRDSENQSTIKKLKMTFNGHACITSWKGRQNMYEKEYTESAKKVWTLVHEQCREKPWRLTPQMHTQAQKKIDTYMGSYYNAGSGRGMKFLQGLKRLFGI